MKYSILIIIGMAISIPSYAADGLNQKDVETINAYVSGLYRESGLTRMPAFDIRTLPASDEKSALIQVTLESAGQYQSWLRELSRQEFSDAFDLACAGKKNDREAERSYIELLIYEAMRLNPQEENKKWVVVYSDDDGYTSFDE